MSVVDTKLPLFFRKSLSEKDSDLFEKDYLTKALGR